MKVRKQTNITEYRNSNDFNLIIIEFQNLWVFAFLSDRCTKKSEKVIWRIKELELYTFHWESWKYASNLDVSEKK